MMKEKTLGGYVVCIYKAKFEVEKNEVFFYDGKDLLS